MGKSSLEHRRKGRCSRQVAHRDHQICTPVAEKSIVRRILNLCYPEWLSLRMRQKNESLSRFKYAGQKHRSDEPHPEELDSTLLPSANICETDRSPMCLCNLKQTSHHSSPLSQARKGYSREQSLPPTSFFLHMKPTENPNVIPRRAPTDADRRRMCIHYKENCRGTYVGPTSWVLPGPLYIVTSLLYSRTIILSHHDKNPTAKQTEIGGGWFYSFLLPSPSDS